MWLVVAKMVMELGVLLGYAAFIDEVEHFDLAFEFVATSLRALVDFVNVLEVEIQFFILAFQRVQLTFAQHASRAWICFAGAIRCQLFDDITLHHFTMTVLVIWAVLIFKFIKFIFTNRAVFRRGITITNLPHLLQHQLSFQVASLTGPMFLK